MNYFLGFFLNDQSRRQVVHRLSEISKIFSEMGIQVRWIKPSYYHIKIQNLGHRVGLVKRVYISYRLKNLFKKSIPISLGNIKLGTSRNLKGLIYVEIEEGGDLLREFRYEMIKTLKIKDNVQFIPHVAIGRINKELSRQEESNILRDIEHLSQDKNYNKNIFDVSEIDLVKVNEDAYEILRKFDTCSCA